MDTLSRANWSRLPSRRGVLAGLPLAGMLLTSCGLYRPSYEYSYRLTVSIDANGVTHTGSSVVHVREWNEQTIDEGWMGQGSIRGEATAVQLGGGRVVEALRNSTAPLPIPSMLARRATWVGGPTSVLLHVYGIEKPVFTDEQAYAASIRALASARGPRELGSDQLPDLVGFLRADDPNSAVLLDPNDLSVLGPGVRWRSAQIEVTDSPVTSGIEDVLPWLKTRLEAERSAGGYTVTTTKDPDWFIPLPNAPRRSSILPPSALKSD